MIPKIDQWLRRQNIRRTTCKRIKNHKIPDHLKEKILSTYKNVIFPQNYDLQSNTADLIGYKTKFASLGPFEYLFKEIFINQAYLFDTDKISPVIFDCGSNIGIAAIYFKSLYPNCELTAFEPDQAAFSCLQHNMENNDFASVELHQVALAAYDGEIDFYIDDTLPGSLIMSTKFERMPKQKVRAKAARLSGFIKQEIDFLKLDIEGGEDEVIKDLEESGKLRMIKNMAIEYHHHIDQEADNLASMLKILEAANFGYQIQANFNRPLPERIFQDILIYAYRK